MRPTSDAYHTCVTAVTSTKRCHHIQFRHVRRWSQTKRYATDKGKTAMIETGWCIKKAPCPPGSKLPILFRSPEFRRGLFLRTTLLSTRSQHCTDGGTGAGFFYAPTGKQKSGCCIKYMHGKSSTMPVRPL